ncbi:3-hydroxyacyl-CoA dehydrogenase family protein [Streptomyces sp. NBC_01235]
MGPPRLLDLVGLDTAQAVAESMYEAFREPPYAPTADPRGRARAW